MSSLSKIFIIHYSKLNERKKHMLTELEKWFPHIDCEFVEEYDQEDLTSEVILENFDLDEFQRRFDRELLRSEMSLCMKYKKAVSAISNSEVGEPFLRKIPFAILKQWIIYAIAKI